MDMFTSSPWLVLAGALFPFVTALMAKARAPDFQKGLVSLALAVIAGLAKAWLGDGSFAWDTFGDDVAVVWTTHLVTWLGISSTAVTKLNNATSEFGVHVVRKRT